MPSVGSRRLALLPCCSNYIYKHLKFFLYIYYILLYVFFASPCPQLPCYPGCNQEFFTWRGKSKTIFCIYNFPWTCWEKISYIILNATFCGFRYNLTPSSLAWNSASVSPWSCCGQTCCQIQPTDLPPHWGLARWQPQE